MRTPFDTASRALKRELDDMRTSIVEAAHHLGQIERQHGTLTAAARSEADIAAADWRLPVHHFQAHSRNQRRRLAEAQRAGEAQLETLRQAALEGYGSLKAVEGAAERFREEAGRAIASAEQTVVDDFAGARVARALRVARSAPRP